jgi:hypothetical protein
VFGQAGGRPAFGKSLRDRTRCNLTWFTPRDPNLLNPTRSPILCGRALVSDLWQNSSFRFGQSTNPRQKLRDAQRRKIYFELAHDDGKTTQARVAPRCQRCARCYVDFLYEPIKHEIDIAIPDLRLPPVSEESKLLDIGYGAVGRFGCTGRILVTRSIDFGSLVLAKRDPPIQFGGRFICADARYLPSKTVVSKSRLLLGSTTL